MWQVLERIISLIVCIVLTGVVTYWIYCFREIFKYGVELNKLALDNEERKHYPERYEEVNKLLDYHTNN